MFVGREEEISLIKEIAENKNKCLLLYGKRKVGKTTLLKKALENNKDKTIYYECIKTSLHENINNFVEILFNESIIPVKILFNSLQDVFVYLNSLPINLNIVIDEYPYLKKFEHSETIDSIFQSIIDNNLKNISLFISGSHVEMMKNLLEEKNALYGRFNTIIKLKELNYYEASYFYLSKTPYEKIAFYSIFGGSPFINSCIDENKTLKDNIIDTILNIKSGVSNYSDNLLMTDLSTSINADRILQAISNGKKKHKDIESKIGFEKNGLLSKHLKTMIDMDLISKKYPINVPNDNKKVFYEINDNLIRFYYTYVYNNKSSLEILGPERFYEAYIEPTINTFISYRFEDICRSYFSILVKNKKISDVLNIGTYYYDDSTNKKNGEFDIAIKKKDSCEIFESKYYTEPLKKAEMLNEERQIKEIKNLNVSQIGFISANGFEKKIDRFKYIDGNELYSFDK